MPLQSTTSVVKYGEWAAVCKIGIKHKIPLQQNLKKTGGKLQFTVGS
jgi:hypothetical protein